MFFGGNLAFSVIVFGWLPITFGLGWWSTISASLVGLAIGSGRVSYLAAWVVVGAGLGASLYDPAFASLGRIFGSAARRPITVLTLAGGFASTVGWPTTHLLLGTVGWAVLLLACVAVATVAARWLVLAAGADSPRGDGSVSDTTDADGPSRSKSRSTVTVAEAPVPAGAAAAPGPVAADRP